MQLNIFKNKLSLMWLYLAIFSLSMAGLLSLSVVFLRIPFFAKMITEPQHFFDLSLAVHVNLSVLIWMCSITMSSLYMFSRGYSKFDLALFCFSFLSTLCIVFSIFIPNSVVFKSNYIPVIDNFLFISGIFTFLICVLIAMFSSVIKMQKNKSMNFALVSIAISFLCSIFCFVFAYSVLNYENDVQFYETLFWGGGHALQFVFVGSFILICCLLDSRVRCCVNEKILKFGYVLSTILVLLLPFGYLVYDINNPSLNEFFTNHMIICAGILPLFFLISSFKNILNFFKAILNSTPLLNAFLLSAYGGILGFMTIQGNVTVPAHYHGSIISITIVFMGFVYKYLEFEDLNSFKLSSASVQIYLYSFGQILHITALEWLGGYNALRKVSSLPESTSIIAKILFGIGGLISIVGGLMFCVLVFRKILSPKITK